jgi:DAK2 domain fusion protein YloV
MIAALDGDILVRQAQLEQESHGSIGHFDADGVLEFGYCTEFILQLQNAKVDIANFDIKVIVDFLETLGDSIVAFKDEDIVKVHVHTFTPGKVIEYCQQFGEYVTFKMENMSVQHNESEDVQALCDCPECVELRELQERKKYAVVAVASGEGLVQTFKEMGVDYIVSGGQSMNPSAEDFVKGFDLINAENIIVFPNNSNIMLTAQQAAKYYEKANILVANSKSLAQGYSALTMLDVSSGDSEQILSEINDVIKNVTTGLVTYSIRDAELDGISIHKDDYIGICNSKMVSSEKTKADALKVMLEKTDLSEKEIITIIYGADVTEAEVEEIREYIESTYEDLEVDVIEGKQEVYSYILSIE